MATQDEPLRMDETHKRLLDWTYGQPPSERLSAQVLDAAHYEEIDPSHPLGGPDGGRDGECTFDGESGVWAVYFPRGQQSPKAIETKLTADINAARKHNPKFLAFVTNQEVLQSERTHLRSLGGDNIRVDLFHLERIAGILDRPYMAPVREQFLRIGATGLSPMNIKVSVDGSAHAFLNDAEVLNALVGFQEKQIRKRSEEGHARVRQERAAKEQAEQRERARKLAEHDRAARGSLPWDVATQMSGIGEIIHQRGLLDSLGPQRVEIPEYLLRLSGTPPPKLPEPLSEDEIQQRIATYRALLEGRWPACRDYLASVAWPALRIHIANEAESFLNDVQVILTFHGARGIRHKGLSAYQVQKVGNPNWEPPSGTRSAPVKPIPAMIARRADYPIEWRHNDDGDLQVTITLPQLRPHPEWRSEHHGDDVVLLRRST